jgi:isoprenylcysteine carboxyl methyltransferase (ICMT) family protein YpbQ
MLGADHSKGYNEALMGRNGASELGQKKGTNISVVHILLYAEKAAMAVQFLVRFSE